jgi:CP family cyanate transporter-like MFS transporter
MKMMLRTLLGSKQVWIATIIGSSSFLIFYGFGNWLPTLLEAKGMSPAEAGWLASLPGWIGLIGSAIIPGLASTGSRKPIIIVILLIEGVAIYVIGLAFELLLLGSLVIYGFISGATLPLMLVVLMDLPDVGAEFTGVASGLFFSIGASMGFIGPIIVGYLTDLSGAFLPAVIVLAITVEAMVVITLLLKEK